MPRQPTLQEVIRSAIDSRMHDVHTRLACRVKSYDAAKQVVDVELVVRGSVQSADDDGSSVLEDLPVVPNVPVEWPSAGGFYFHMPIAPGDEGIISFFESSIASFRETGEVGGPGDLRRHSMSSATFVPCPLSNAKRLSDAPTDHAIIAVPPGKFVQVSNPGGSADFVALKSAVDTLQQKMDSHFHPTGVGPSGTISPILGPLASSTTLKA